MRNPSQSYGVLFAIWDHTVLPATRHKWTCPARQAGARFTYPGGMEGWVDLGSLIAAQPGIEPMAAWSQVRRPSRYATKPPAYCKYLHVYLLPLENPDRLLQSACLILICECYCLYCHVSTLCTWCWWCHRLLLLLWCRRKPWRRRRWRQPNRQLSTSLWPPMKK